MSGLREVFSSAGNMAVAFEVNQQRPFTYLIEGSTMKLGVGSLLGESTFVTLTKK